jgi:S1-C subfamily serine protease
LVKNGLGVDGVRPGGPAFKAGIIKGDKITAINGEPVTNIYDYMFRLSKLKPQSVANVEVERKGKKEVLLVKL